MEDERKYGTCPVCNEKKMLISFLASYKGQPVAGWMCNKCYAEIRDKRSVIENVHHYPERNRDRD